MFKNKSANARTAATAVFAALFAAWALHPADAQQRKSIRWAVARHQAALATVASVP